MLSPLFPDFYPTPQDCLDSQAQPPQLRVIQLLLAPVLTKGIRWPVSFSSIADRNPPILVALSIVISRCRHTALHSWLTWGLINHVHSPKESSGGEINVYMRDNQHLRPDSGHIFGFGFVFFISVWQSLCIFWVHSLWPEVESSAWEPHLAAQLVTLHFASEMNFSGGNWWEIFLRVNS